MGIDKSTHTIKIPVGTIVKVEGHPVRLAESLYIRDINGDLFLEKHEIMETENEQPIHRHDKCQRG